MPCSNQHSMSALQADFQTSWKMLYIQCGDITAEEKHTSRKPARSKVTWSCSAADLNISVSAMLTTCAQSAKPTQLAICIKQRSRTLRNICTFPAGIHESRCKRGVCRPEFRITIHQDATLILGSSWSGQSIEGTTEQWKRPSAGLWPPQVTVDRDL